MSTLSDSSKKPISEKEAASMADNRLKRILSGVERADKVDRSLLFIGFGMILQVALLFELEDRSAYLDSDCGLAAHLPRLREVPPWLGSLELQCEGN